VGFQFDGVPGGRAFAIKPAASGVATNITVYTNRRSYYFHVVEARETPHYVVQFRYPDAQARPARCDGRRAKRKLCGQRARGVHADRRLG
jgi:type IV secretion system protein VirB9